MKNPEREKVREKEDKNGSKDADVCTTEREKTSGDRQTEPDKARWNIF